MYLPLLHNYFYAELELLRVKLHLNQGETDSVKIGRWVRQGNCMSPILFNLYAEYLMKEALAEVGDFKIGGRIINKVWFADDTAITAQHVTAVWSPLRCGQCAGVDQVQNHLAADERLRHSVVSLGQWWRREWVDICKCRHHQVCQLRSAVLRCQEHNKSGLGAQLHYRDVSKSGLGAQLH